MQTGHRSQIACAPTNLQGNAGVFAWIGAARQVRNTSGPSPVSHGGLPRPLRLYLFVQHPLHGWAMVGHIAPLQIGPRTFQVR
jgi:hypothetical protein